MYETTQGGACGLACTPGAGHVRRVAVEAATRFHGDAS